ncbi:MAG: hypothetical protein ABWZ25_04060 [Chitinophagaceae bacterium]
MNNNPLLEDLKTYFKEVYVINGRISTLDASLTRFGTEMRIEGDPDQTLIGSMTTFRDITQHPAGDFNLYAPDFSYDIIRKDVDTELENLRNDYFCLSVAQCYEVFESFLFNILSSYFELFPEELAKVGLLNTGSVLVREDIRSLVLKKAQGANNDGLRSILKKCSTHYEAHEKKNEFFDLNLWFTMISQVRHVLVHGRKILSSNFFENLKQRKCLHFFQKYFQTRKTETEESIFIDRLATLNLISDLNSFSFFIFKSLSVEQSMSISVPQYGTGVWFNKSTN